jgi:hypothetical protein
MAYYNCAGDLRDLTGVSFANVEYDHPDVDGPCLVVKVDPYERVPPRVLRTLTEYDLGIDPALCGSRETAHELVVV